MTNYRILKRAERDPRYPFRYFAQKLGFFGFWRNINCFSWSFGMEGAEEYIANDIAKRRRFKGPLPKGEVVKEIEA